MHSVEYNPFSDHHDEDHYDYYTMYIPNFLEGKKRNSQQSFDEYFATQQEIENLEVEQKAIMNNSFEALVELFKKLSFVKVMRYANSNPESVNKLERRFNWSDVMDRLGVDIQNLFSALVVIEVIDESKFHELISKFQNDFHHHFRLGRVSAYLGDRGVNNSRSNPIYDLHLQVHPVLMTNQMKARREFNAYFDAIRTVIAAE